MQMRIHHLSILLIISIILVINGGGCQVKEKQMADNPGISGIEIMRKNLQQNIEILDGLKINWRRMNGLSWAEVEYDQGIYDWEIVSSLETEIIQANSMGHRVILIVRQTPEWAQIVNGSLCGPIAEEHVTAFAEFMKRAVARYSKEPYNVKYWEILNEPGAPFQSKRENSPYGCWGDINDTFYGGEYYGWMLQAIYPVIKESDPDAVVLVGGLLLDCDPIDPPLLEENTGKKKDCRQSNFLEGIISAGGGDYFDGISFHAYDYYYGKLGRYGNENWSSNWQLTGPVITAKTEFLKALLEKYSILEKLLINTETALICGNVDSPGCKSFEFVQTKAGYITQSYATAAANDLDGNIWYSLIGWRGSGLLDHNLEETVAFKSYETAVNIFADAQYIRRVDISGDVIGYEFRDDQSTFWVLWSTHEDGVKLILDDQPLQAFNNTGNEMNVGDSIDLGFEPIYIYWASE